MCSLFKMNSHNFVYLSFGIIFILFVGLGVGEWKAIENPCLCQEFRCPDGTCLHKERVCNSVKDCFGGEDETNNLTTSGKCTRKRNKCNSTTEFKCKFGGCIKLTEVCDGQIHCWGAVDEASDLCTWVHSD